mgnify:FL=1
MARRGGGCGFGPCPHNRRGRRGRRGASRGYTYRRARFGSSALERLAILTVIAIIVGVSAGLLLPKISPAVNDITGGDVATGDAATTLNTLTVDDHPSPSSSYKRDDFGFRKTDDDGDGCDVREAVLARDLTDVTYTKSGGCKVKTGHLNDPYTGAGIDFVRGPSTSARVQIDHVVALENAWKSGASEWTTAERYRFANDTYNLLAVDGGANEAKGSASAASWLPENTTYQCPYVARQIGVKAKYQLSVTSKEKQAMLGVLHTCPGQGVPER